ncbi:hypothetical protein UlMin_011929 [Ulmus minor]
MSSTTTKGNGNAQACAACKYQRRKCAPDCVLAPYFPHDTQKQFLNAHKLFGVSNITKVIKNLQQPMKDEAMRTIIYQSDARANDPVGGCYRIICDLQRQIEYHKAELEIVLHQLAICRASASQQQQNLVDSSSCDVLNVDGLSLYNNVPIQYYGVSPDQYVVDDVGSWVIQDNSVSSSHVREDVDRGCDEIKPLLNGSLCENRDEREVIEQSNEVEDTILFKEEDEYSIQQQQQHQHQQDHDLRDAATLFTLTNCTS